MRVATLVIKRVRLVQSSQLENTPLHLVFNSKQLHSILASPDPDAVYLVRKADLQRQSLPIDSHAQQESLTLECVSHPLASQHSVSLSDCITLITQRNSNSLHPIHIPANRFERPGAENKFLSLIQKDPTLEELQGFWSKFRSDVRIDCCHSNHGGTALHIASALGHLGVVRFLIEHGASVNARGLNGSTPLHWAAGSGSVQVVRCLLDHGADAKIPTWTWSRNAGGRGSGQTPLHWAAESGHDDVVELILERDPLALVCADEREKRPLDVATDKAEKYLRDIGKTELIAIKLHLQTQVHKIIQDS